MFSHCLFPVLKSLEQFVITLKTLMTVADLLQVVSTRLIQAVRNNLLYELVAINFLRGNFFQCHVFAMKSVQNLKSFWRSSQNYFVLALFSSL
jgi:hypothetical protein